MKALWQEITHTFELLEVRDISWKDIHVGLPGNSFRIKCCNSIILMIKHNCMLYLSRTAGAVPSVVKVQKSLMEYREDENKIAVKLMWEIGIYLLKWECVKVS